MKITRILLAGLAMAAVSATQASATNWAGNGSYCGGSAFSTCYSVDLSWTGSGTSISVVLKLRNDDSFNSGLKWFSVGMDNLPADIVSTLGAVPVNYTGNNNDFNGGPFVAGTAAAGHGGDAPGSAYRTWNFTFTGNSRTGAQWDAVMNAAGVGYHAGGTLCGSTKVIARDNLATGSAYGTNSAAASACDVPSLNTVPEPATMGLLALGLVGMAGAGFVRRRRTM